MSDKLECTCIEAYKSRKMRDPNCCACSCDHSDLVEKLEKANERVKDLEAHNELLMDVSWQMKEGKPDAFYKIKDARNTQPSDALNKFAIEKKIEGYYASCIESGMNDGQASLLSDIYAEQLRKEQE